MFALWDASKYGHVGSYEWVQVSAFMHVIENEIRKNSII